MKKFLLAVVSVAMLTFATPAYADNSEEVIIGVLGGAIGGLILGEILGNRPVYVAPRYNYYDDYYAGAPVKCVYKKKRIYDLDFDEYVVVKKRVCYR
jgi:hypothetical protein